MKHYLFNLTKNTAKEAQITGGGASQVGTESRELPGNPRPLRYLCATLALPLRYVAMILMILTLGVGQMWATYSYNHATSVPEWTVNFDSWNGADDAATTTAETVHNPRLYYDSSKSKWNSHSQANDIGFDAGGFYYMYQPGTARQLPTGDALSALCYVVAKAQGSYFKYNNTSSTVSSPATTINGLTTNNSQTTDVAYVFHMPRAGYIRLLIGTDSNGDPTGTANDSWKNVTLSGATTGTVAVTYHASGATYDVKTKTGATTFSTTTYTSAGKKLRSVEFAVNSGTTTMTTNPAKLSNNSGTARKMFIYAVEVYMEEASGEDPSCEATAVAGEDKSTTVGVGVAMAATAASSGYTGAWSIKAGSPSTATSQLGTTSSNTMTFTPNTYGTYTLVWTVTDNEDGSCSATDEATVTVPAPTHSIAYTNLKGADNSANPTTYTEGVGVASFANLRHLVDYDFTGWSPSSISSSATTNQTIDAQWSANAAAAGTGTLTYALAFDASTVTTSSITRNNGALYDATDISLTNTSFSDGAVKNGCSGKLVTTSSKSATNYVELTFKIADGYTFTPTEVSVRANAVTTNKTLEVELKDNAATPNSKSVTGALAQGSTSGGATVTLDFDASGEVALEGTVTAKIFVYGATDAWRLGTSVVITGTVASAAPSTKRIYMKAGDWNNDSPKFFVHSWGSSDSDVQLTALGGCESDVFYADIPSGNTSLIFTRQNPSTSSIIWDGSDLWNRTDNISISTYDLFTFATWDGGPSSRSTFTGGTYSAPTYTISFQGNGNTGGSMSSISSIACEADQAVTANAFTKTGYSFTGWHANVDVTVGGATKTAGTLLADGVTIQDISSNITLTAQWEEEVTYTVTYNANGATGSVPTDASSPYSTGATVTVLGKNTLAKTDNGFAGWRTAASSGTWYVQGQTFTMGSANVNLYAQWVPEASLVSGTLYQAADLKSAALTSTSAESDRYRAGISSNGVSEILGTGIANATAGPMEYNTISSTTVGDASFTSVLYFKGTGSGSPSATGTTIPTSRSIKFRVPSKGTLHLYVKGPGSISLIKSGSTAAVIGSGDANAYVTADVTAGTYYLFATASSRSLYGLKFVEESCSATQPGAISKGTLSACTLRLTAAGSPASNNTWYWQSSEDGEDKTESGATKDVTSTGTYYIRSYCTTGSGCWSDAQTVTVSASDLTPAAPTALAAASPTAKGVTLTVTDAANTNDYEFYVSTDDDEPGAGTSATHSVTSGKSLTITDLYAGTTFYAWARAKCGSNKSAWTALGTSTFTTSTVTMTPTLTNVTKSSGAESSIGGSDYTAVFTADEEYSMPNPTVTIGENAATSGTDYTWSVDGSEGTITIPANKINGNIAITLNSADAAPSSAVISGTYHYFPGENISLTCTPSGNNGPTTYQWYKGGKENGNAIAGATSATYTKNSCAFADAGSYYCKVTCNETSIWAVTSSYENYDVKILRLYVNDSKGGEAYGNVDFTKVDGTTATASISLASSRTYGFNIADGCGHYYGNSGTMTENNCTGWTTNVHGTDCGLTTTNAATYVFTINYSSLEAITTSVTYPTANQAADKVIYFDNQTVDWSTLHYRIGKSNHTQATAMTKVSGTNNLYKVTTAEYNGFSGWHIANNAGWTGSNSIYRTDTDGDEYEITYATAHEGGAVTDAAITVTPTTSKGTGDDTGINDNCEFYNYSLTTGMKTDRVTISSYSNGTITVNYVDTDDEAASFTSGYADLAHTVVLTSITAVANTGYDASAVTINGGAYSANYVVTGATTIAASFTPQTYSITYKDQGGSSFSGSHVDSPNAHPTTHTYATATTLNSATKTGYTFGGWYTSVDCSTGLVTSLGATDYTADITLYAKWTADTYTITLNKGDHGAANQSATVAYDATALTSITHVTSTGYDRTGYFDGSTKVLEADGSFADDDVTGYITDGKWSKTSDAALTAKWDAQSYTISYKDQGNETYSGSNLASLPTSHTYGAATDFVNGVKSGYRFLGWYTDASCTISAGSSIGATAITANTTYYAKWAQLYTITNGSPANGTITVVASAIAGETVDIEAAANTGYDFSAWSIFKTGTPATTIDPASSSASTNFTMPAYAVTVDASFVLKTYDVTATLNHTTKESGTTGTGAATHGTEYSATFAAADGYVLPSDVTVTIGGVAQTKGTGYTWSVSAGVGTFTVPAAKVTGDIALTITSTVDCPASGSGRTVYKFEVKSDVSSGNICTTQNVPVSLSTPTQLTTLTGGTLQGLVTSSSMNNLAFSSGRIQYANGSAGVLILTLDCAVKTGDIIRFVNYSSSNSKYNYLRHTSNSTTTNQITLNASTTAGTVQEIVVPSAFNNKDVLYIVSGSNTTGISYFEIIRPYVVTLDANTNGGEVGGENTATYYAASGEEIVLPHAFKSDNYFNGWFPNASTGDAVSNPYTPTGSTTLYAQFGDCPDEGTVYKFQVATELTNGNVTEGEVNLGNYVSALEGGSLTAHQNSSKLTIVSNSKIQFADNNVYLKIDLDCALQTGDKFITSIETDKLCITNTGSRSTTNELVVGTKTETDVPAAFVGSKTLWIWRNGTDSKITYFEIIRPEGFAVTYNKNGHGTAPDNVTANVVTLSDITVDGWKNTGWTADVATSAGAAGTLIAPGTTVTLSNNTTFTAQWTQTYLLTYDDGDGSGAPSASYQPNATITLSSTVPTRSGHVFRGWQVGGSGTVYQPSDEFSMPAAAVTLVAKWTAVCMNFAAATSGSKDVDAGTTKEISTASGGYASTLSGGSMSFYGRVGKIGNNDTYGLVFDSKDDELLTVTLSGAMLEAGAIIVLDCYSVNSNSKEVGFTISGNACDEGTYTTTAAAYQHFTRTYVVTEDDGIDGTSTFTIEGATTNKVYLKGMTVAGCTSCTSITPTITGATTLYTYPSVTSTTLTLDKDGSTGGVTWSVTPASGVVTLSGSGTTATVTAVATGTATITASIDPDGEHCGAFVTQEITVAGCDILPIASVVLTSNTTADEVNATAIISGLSGSKKLNDDGGKFGMTLSGDSPFKEGDIINITGTMDGSPTSLTFAVYSSETASAANLLYTTTLSASASIDVNIEVTEDNLTALNTSKKVVVIRTKSPSDGQYDQNPHMAGIYLKRYSCSEGLAEFTGDGDDALWSNTENWAGGKVPTIDDRAIVKKPLVVDVIDAQADEVILDQSDSNTGKLDINAGKELIVATTVRKTTDGETLTATGENDIHIGSTSELGLGALVMGEHDGTNNATVYFATKSHGSKGSTASVSQYVGTPFCNNPAMLYQFYNSWMYKLNDAGDNWIRVNGNNTLEAFRGYAVISADPAGHVYDMSGTLCSSNDVEGKALNYNGSSNTENMLANSWMAPIKIKAFDASDFTNADATIYIFNSGSPDDYEANSGASSYGDLKGQYHSYTVNTAAAADVIPAMQAFSVYATGSGAKITLDHSRLVYDPAAAGTITPVANKVQRRAKVSDDPMTLMGIRVMGSQGWADAVRIYMREDFEQGFENGWDGRKMFGETAAPQLYAITPDGKMTINCIPTFEGTVLGFQAGTDDNNYTFSFQYEGAETLYLNDLKEEQSTLISSENSYQFFTETGDPEARFIISATPYGAPEIATGVENTVQGTDVRKVIINDKMFIIRGGRMYDATGVMVR